MQNTYERNICAEFHCPSACCRKPMLAVAENIDEVNKFGEGESIKYLEPSDFLTAQDFFPPTENTIFVENGIEDNGPIYILVPHDCQHLADNACEYMTKRLKACNGTPVGGAYCTISRNRFDLPPITKQMIDSIE